MIAQRVSAGFRPHYEHPAPEGPTEPPRPRPPECDRLVIARQRPRNTNRIRGIHTGEISRRGAEPLRATGDRERGHP
jgi:hypothetical protein